MEDRLTDTAKRWQSQVPGGGNNIPESVHRRFGLGRRDARPGEPEDRELARFIKEQFDDE